MVGQEDEGQEGRLEDTTEIDNAGEMILLEKAREGCRLNMQHVSERP